MSRQEKAEWVQRIEYGLYRAVAGRVRNARPENVARWGSRLGGVARRMIRKRDRLAMRNLRLVFPDRPESELRAILNRCWQHFGRQALDYLRLQQMPPEEALRAMEFVNV